MKPTKDNTFCWYPFTMLALKSWDTNVGITKAAPCCNSIRPETPDPLQHNLSFWNNPDSITAEQIFHSKEMHELRVSLLNGKKHSACATCWKMESNTDNAYSYRLDSKPAGLHDIKDEETLQDLIQNPQLRSIDFAFGENCNLRCRMCAPGLSNKLRLDYKYFVENDIDTSGIIGFDWKDRKETILKQTGKDSITLEKLRKQDSELTPGAEYKVKNWKDGKQWQNILDNIHKLNHIKATGGETLMSKPFIEFLDTAIEKDVASNIFLEFHTNATKFSNENIEKLKHFDGLHLNCSIDSYGKNYEYIRYPMKWSVLEKSLTNLLERIVDKKYKRTPNGFIKNLSFNIVLSSLNVHYLEDLIKFHLGLYEKYHGKSVDYAVFYVDLLWPEDKYINVKFLPVKTKQKLIDMLQDLKIKYNNKHTDRVYHVQLDSAISFLNKHVDLEPTEEDRLNMLKEIKAFDMSRNQCYNDFIHPDVIEFLETPIE